MTLPYNYISANAQYIPQVNAALQSDFSKNLQDYALTQYVTYCKFNKLIENIVIHDPDEETRAVNNRKWKDGTYAQVNFSVGSKFAPYEADRYERMFTIGDQAQDQTLELWNLVANSATKATKALMKDRVKDVFAVLTQTGLWPSANIQSVADIVGSSVDWTDATSTTPYIQQSIQAGMVAIKKATNSSVNVKNLALVINPDIAVAMSQTDEIRNYVKSSPFAGGFLSGVGDGNGLNWAMGLPEYLYGVKVIVEDTIENAALKGETRDANFVQADTVAYLLSRPGTLEGDLNTLSSISLGLYDDFKVNLVHNPLHMLTEGLVYNTYAVIDRFPSAFAITGVIS